MTPGLRGLVAATHTPFRADGALDLAAVERQAAHLVATGVGAAFIGGTTGECHSLTLEERTRLAARWLEVARGTPLDVVVHVGGNCLADARALAAQAQGAGARAIAAMAPSYFRPASIDALVACCAEVAAAAPGLPFYFYDIPAMTGVAFPMPAFLERAGPRVPTLRGLKFTNADLMAFQQCLALGDGRFDVLWGIDEMLIGALAAGAQGAVGSTYNFAAPLYLRLIGAFTGGDLATARREQLRSAALVQALSKYGYMAAAREAMGLVGVEVGPPRLPHLPLTDTQRAGLRRDLEALGEETIALRR
jgi:N-acetylneuraminate lyase